MENSEQSKLKDEANLIRSSNPPAKKLRTQTLLDFVKVIPKELYGTANTSYAEELKHKEDMCGGGLTRKDTNGQIDNAHRQV